MLSSGYMPGVRNKTVQTRSATFTKQVNISQGKCWSMMLLPSVRELDTKNC